MCSCILVCLATSGHPWGLGSIRYIVPCGCLFFAKSVLISRSSHCSTGDNAGGGRGRDRESMASAHLHGSLSGPGGSRHTYTRLSHSVMHIHVPGCQVDIHAGPPQTICSSLRSRVLKCSPSLVPSALLSSLLGGSGTGDARLWLRMMLWLWMASRGCCPGGGRCSAASPSEELHLLPGVKCYAVRRELE